MHVVVDVEEMVVEAKVSACDIAVATYEWLDERWEHDGLYDLVKGYSECIHWKTLRRGTSIDNDNEVMRLHSFHRTQCNVDCNLIVLQTTKRASISQHWDHNDLLHHIFSTRHSSRSVLFSCLVNHFEACLCSEGLWLSESSLGGKWPFVRRLGERR